MRCVELTIRSPVGAAWLSTALSFMCTGELYHRLNTSNIIQIFGTPFLKDELAPALFILSALTLILLAWLLSLYFLPGKIQIDHQSKTLTRTRLSLFRPHTLKRPLHHWTADVTFFSTKHKEIRVFKEITLTCDQHREILFFSDLRRGEELVEALDDIRIHLKAFQERVRTS